MPIHRSYGWIPDVPDQRDHLFAAAPSILKDALKSVVLGYQRLLSTNLNQLKGCIAAGFPFVFGFAVYDSFESQAVATTGEASMPGPGERLRGGHAVLAVGYDDATQRFAVRNSWGKDWSVNGYYTMPYAYLTNATLADDFWTIRVLKQS